MRPSESEQATFRSKTVLLLKILARRSKEVRPAILSEQAVWQLATSTLRLLRTTRTPLRPDNV